MGGEFLDQDERVLTAQLSVLGSHPSEMQQEKERRGARTADD
jgi:hypothetical protein